MEALDSDDEDESDESETECDPNGDVAICEVCNKVLPLSRYERHLSYFCRKQAAECPMCFIKLPMSMIQEHLENCELRVIDPDMVTCKFCKARMRKHELKDHAVAHLVDQKQVEMQIVERVADIEDFFEQEALESAGSAKAPLLDKKQLAELPLSKYAAPI